MSDRPLADDWWLASDGKWYPPQSRTQPPPPPPPMPPAPTADGPQPAPAVPYPAGQYGAPSAYGAQLGGRAPRSLSQGLTGTLMGFSIATGVLFMIAGAVYFATWGLWTDFRDNGSTSFSDVVQMAEAGDGFAVFALLLAVVSFVLIIIWLNQAYKSAASRGAEGTKWSSGWAVGGWFIPFANVVIPKLVINEVDRMSQQDLVEPIGTTWRGKKRTAVSDWWWVFQLGGLFLANIGDAQSFDGDLEFLLLSALGYVIGGIGFILGGVAVRTIGSRLRF